MNYNEIESVPSTFDRNTVIDDGQFVIAIVCGAIGAGGQDVQFSTARQACQFRCGRNCGHPGLAIANQKLLQLCAICTIWYNCSLMLALIA